MPYTKIDNPNEVLLGDGAVCFVDDVCVGITRGGTSFKTNVVLKHIDADGDKGEVKGRHRKTECKPTLELNLLQIITENIKNYYSGLSITDLETGKSKITGKQIGDSDYHDVCVVGKTKDGREVVIKVFDAINLEGIDMSVADKEETVAKMTFTATYDQEKLNENADYEPWEITFVKPSLVKS